MQVLQHIPLPDLQAVLRDHGVVAGLCWLNDRVPHRCTALYQLKASTIRLQYLFDRLGQTLPRSMAVVPLTDSYCQHAIRDGRFLADDTQDDARVDGSPFQGIVRAYHAVALAGKDGRLFGTLCHFDFEPRQLPQRECALMRSAGTCFSPYL